MAAPVVQSLEQIMADLDPAFAQSRNLYNQQIAAVPGKYDAQKQGLQVQKGNEFRNINRGANAKGLAFSGIPVEEQTRYLGEKFLPGMQAFDQQANQETMGLQGMLAQLGQNQSLKALDTRTGQQGALSQYEQAEADRQFKRESEERQRTFDAQQAEQNRGIELRKLQMQQAESRAAQPNNVEIFASGLARAAGRDGKVSPGDYNRLKNQWVASGYGSFADFHNKFWKFANDSHWWDYR